MSIKVNLQKYNQLKKALAETSRKAERAAGALEELAKTLAEDFSCPSVKAAAAKLESLQDYQNSLAHEFNEKLGEIEKEYPDVFSPPEKKA